MSQRHAIGRRACLRGVGLGGVGISMALPLLDSMGWAEQAPSADKANAQTSASAKPPVRLGFM